MLSRLHLQNFTVFADADFRFSPGLNVLVGTNGTGKSHVLKLGYVVDRTIADVLSDPHLDKRTDFNWRSHLNSNLQATFLPTLLMELTSSESDDDAVVTAEYTAGDRHLSFTLPAVPPIIDPATFDDSVSVKQFPSASQGLRLPVFIPPKEVLSSFYGFTALYEKREIDFDLTYPDLCRRLSVPNLRTPAVDDVLELLREAMGGTVLLQGQRFFFQPEGKRYSRPINLYAEGLRKFGILWQLLRNGSLTSETTLFWDEPEANLNPALLRKLARVLAALARNGFQIILATHSLFLLKELHILHTEYRKDAQPLPIRYFGLNADKPGDPVRVTTVDDFEVLPDIVALDEELHQTVGFQRAMDANFDDATHS